ncbi:predicted protein [Lichtheimia corymbifera JMRC:FSU:9682]|uniref:Uncharacterized protein n=1 Tax=Lichtheimia corymbifera JMRC:FSU:9682 TaxID=1263082 RepID=A0A068RTB1_9FUNG|nr:predicted protein [Lichtheimia corymbifera JMRC:FSU:9682]
MYMEKFLVRLCNFGHHHLFGFDSQPVSSGQFTGKASWTCPFLIYRDDDYDDYGIHNDNDDDNYDNHARNNDNDNDHEIHNNDDNGNEILKEAYTIFLSVLDIGD